MTKRAILILSMVGLMGCATTVWWGSPSNVRTTTLSVGMSKQQAQALLGPPQRMMTRELNGVMIETWKYLDRTLTFQNGLLQSWQSGSTKQDGS